jgi:hypothetical protein
MLHVTAHAIERYRERVENVPTDEIHRRLSGRAFDIASSIGADVILPTGHRAVIRSGLIITILPSKRWVARRKKDEERE